MILCRMPLPIRLKELEELQAESDDRKLLDAATDPMAT